MGSSSRGRPKKCLAYAQLTKAVGAGAASGDSVVNAALRGLVDAGRVVEEDKRADAERVWALISSMKRFSGQEGTLASGKAMEVEEERRPVAVATKQHEEPAMVAKIAETCYVAPIAKKKKKKNKTKKTEEKKTNELSQTSQVIEKNKKKNGKARVVKDVGKKDSAGCECGDDASDSIVESLVGRRKHTGKDGRVVFKYRVKWLGYPLSKSTWEPEANLMEDGLGEHVADYDAWCPRK